MTLELDTRIFADALTFRSNVTLEGSFLGPLTASGAATFESTASFESSLAVQATGSLLCLNGEVNLGAAIAGAAMLKGSGVTVQVRRGDDSGFGGFETGQVVSFGKVIAGAAYSLQIAGRGQILSNSTENLTLSNAAANGFGMLLFGGATAAFPAFRRNGDIIEARLGDNSDFAIVAANEPTADDHVATKKYVDDNSGSGAPPNFHIWAEDFQTPSGSDWPVTVGAPAIPDPANNALSVRQFIDSAETGASFMMYIPADVTTMSLLVRSKAAIAPGSPETVSLNLYHRGVPDNAAIETWSSALSLAGYASLPTNIFYQYDTTDIDLATESIENEKIYQFEITRDTADAGDTLTGDWLPIEAWVVFS